jgi:hypothetical protein
LEKEEVAKEEENNRDPQCQKEIVRAILAQNRRGRENI